MLPTVKVVVVVFHAAAAAAAATAAAVTAVDVICGDRITLIAACVQDDLGYLLSLPEDVQKLVLDNLSVLHSYVRAVKLPKRTNQCYMSK
uniref:Secreted protein n=1 Tax=Glossina palpalis gambiensis TaxID=67801 RepID=A0A1B0AYC0_9MUSC